MARGLGLGLAISFGWCGLFLICHRGLLRLLVPYGGMLHSDGGEPSRAHSRRIFAARAWREKDEPMKLLLFCILLVVCWPLALVALVLYPFVWLVLLPFRIVGIAVGGVLELVGAIFTLPARVLRSI